MKRYIDPRGIECKAYLEGAESAGIVSMLSEKARRYYYGGEASLWKVIALIWPAPSGGDEPDPEPEYSEPRYYIGFGESHIAFNELRRIPFDRLETAEQLNASLEELQAQADELDTEDAE